MSENIRNQLKRTMMLEIVTPYQHFYEGKVESVILTSLDGQLGVLPGHAPLVVALTPGITKIVVNGEEKYAVLSEGFAEIGQHLAFVVCNAAEWPEEIDVRRAHSAYSRAHERYQQTEARSEENQYSRHSMRRARERLHAIEKHGTDRQKRTLERLQNESPEK